jgi:hypothetical protein
MAAPIYLRGYTTIEYFLNYYLSCILVGETFILFNKQIKGNKRELIQLGVPIFGQIKEDTKSKKNLLKEIVIYQVVLLYLT